MSRGPQRSGSHGNAQTGAATSPWIQDGTPIGETFRQMIRPLAVTYAFLPLTFLLAAVDSTRAPYFDLTTPFARATYWITESCGPFGAPLLGALMLLVLITRPGISGGRRAKEALLVVLAVALLGGGGSYLNENVIKAGFRVPRPNIVLLSGSDGNGPLNMLASEFYEMDDKAARKKPLELALMEGSSPVELSPAVREHWINTTGYSFPSGHSMAAMFLATFFLGLGISHAAPPRRWIFFLMLPWAVAVCYSRSILRVHTPADLTVGGLQGILLGFAALVAVRAALATWHGHGETPVSR